MFKNEDKVRLFRETEDKEFVTNNIYTRNTKNC